MVKPGRSTIINSVEVCLKMGIPFQDWVENPGRGEMCIAISPDESSTTLPPFN